MTKTKGGQYKTKIMSDYKWSVFF